MTRDKRQRDEESLDEILDPAHGLPALSGANAEDVTSAQRELQSALEASGISSMIMCAKGDVSPAALYAIAATVRSLEPGE